MKVERVFINTYRYDFHFAKICIASVRYWYPAIPIYLIKDEGQGKFDTSDAEKKWNVSVLDISRKKFGWGYGKLETLFLEPRFSFLVLDADTVMTGPVIDAVKDAEADLIVDEEVQPLKRFNEIYYNLERINELDSDFKYPGYSFNSGQWFGTTGVITRGDFNLSLEWDEPPACKNADIVFKGDQAHLNFVVHRLQQQNKITVSRKRIMVWPNNGAADFIDVNGVKEKRSSFPYIIHWAGMGNDLAQLPRTDIINFFESVYYSGNAKVTRIMDHLKTRYLGLEKKIRHKLNAK